MKQTPHVRIGAALLLAAAGLAALWIAGYVLLQYGVDALWFASAGFARVFWTILGTRAMLAVVAGVLAFAALYGNVRIARRFTPGLNPLVYIRLELDPGFAEAVSRLLFFLVPLFFAILLGFSVAENWTEFVFFLHASPFGLDDPVFGHDVGFYVFRLPAVAYTCQLALVLCGLCMVLTIAVHFSRGTIDLSGEGRVLSQAAFSQLSALAGCMALLAGARCWLARYQLLFDKRGAVFGAGYTAVHADLWANTFLAAMALVVAAWFIANAFLRKRPGNLFALGGYLVAWLLVGTAYPAAVQTFLVRPNELAREEPYIRRNIEFTRRAYGLDQITERTWQGDGALSPAQLAAHPGTVDNLLLWDPAPLLDIFNQKQRIRLYYDFKNVDVDRYTIDGKLRPVMLAARELDPRLLPDKSLVWTNLYLQYTHGYGLCLSLGNRAEPGGLPEFLVSNIPPETAPGLDVVQPRIYYGEQTHLYTLADTKLEEFDYPGDPENVFTHYDGQGGLPVGGFFRRALLSWYTGHKEIFFTDQFTKDSRIMLYREVRERAQRIAPFLEYDEDPYPVLLDGRVVWILDAYTLTRRFPYSEVVGMANYWRNSVKVTIDAYDGTVTFYRFDTEDPILRVFDRVFPGLFQPMERMPEDLRAHLRYPNDLFRVQTAMYRRYHMDEPRLFFNGEDMWTFPKSGNSQGVSFEPPRYFVLELPESGAPEQFVLSRTFTVEGKDNMIAWMSAGCDPGHYGELTVYRLSKQRNIYGPTQAKGRFNQDPGVSQFMTLMGQLGSAVIQSKVLAVPIEQGLLYVQSLYVEDPQVKIPELKQIVLGCGDRVAMAPTMAEALERLFSEGEIVPETPPSEAERVEPLDAPQADAQRLYDQARERLQAGDWAGFGEAFDALGRLLRGKEPSGQTTR